MCTAVKWNGRQFLLFGILSSERIRLFAKQRRAVRVADHASAANKSQNDSEKCGMKLVMSKLGTVRATIATRNMVAAAGGLANEATVSNTPIKYGYTFAL